MRGLLRRPVLSLPLAEGLAPPVKEIGKKTSKHPGLLVFVSGRLPAAPVPTPRGWAVQKSNPSEDNIFHNHPNQPRGPHSLLYNRYWVSFVGVNLQGCDINHPPPTSTSYSYVAPLLLDTTSCKDGYHITKQLACSAFGADIVSNICVNAFRT